MRKVGTTLIGLLACWVASAQVVEVDETDPGFTKFGPTKNWTRAWVGNRGSMVWTRRSDTLRTKVNWATWLPALPKKGAYKLEVFIPNRNGTTRNATYKIRTSSGVVNKVVDQFAINNRWYDLGTHEFTPGSALVYLDDLTGERNPNVRIGYDTMRWTFVGGSPPPVGGKNPPEVQISGITMISKSLMEVRVTAVSSKSSGHTITVVANFPGKSLTTSVTAKNPIKVKSRYSIGASVTFDLAKLGVPKFVNNVQVPILAVVTDPGGSGMASGVQEFLLPIILVRGVDPFDGSAGQPDRNAYSPGLSDFRNFVYLIESKRLEKAPKNTYFSSVGYKPEQGFENFPYNPYPTLYGLQYHMNRDDLATSAQTLAGEVGYAVAKT